LRSAAGKNENQGATQGNRQVTSNRQSLCSLPVRLTVACLLATLAGAAAAQPPVWKTGAALRKELELPLSLTWEDREARAGLANLAKSTGVAILLDRRVDPEQKLQLAARDESLQLVLLRVAEQLDCGVTLVGSVVYLGPKQTSTKLATLAALRRQEVQALPNEAKSLLVKSEAWQWDELAEPRDLLADLAGRGRVKVEGAEAIPHDLWPATSWPAMPWTERMTLLLAGFGLTFELVDAGKTIRLVPIPAELTFEKTYSPRGDAADAAAQLRRLAPQAKIAVEGQRLRIAASAEDHDKIDRLLKGERVRTTQVTPGEKRYTLTVENQPAGAVAKTVAGQLGKELKYDPQVRERLRTSVSFAVKDVPLEQLMEKALGPLGLTYKLDDKTLVIVERE
jgi:hypothetical protein